MIAIAPQHLVDRHKDAGLSSPAPFVLFTLSTFRFLIFYFPLPYILIVSPDRNGEKEGIVLQRMPKTGDKLDRQQSTLCLYRFLCTLPFQRLVT